MTSRPPKGQRHIPAAPSALAGVRTSLFQILVLPRVPSDPSPRLCPCSLGLYSHPVPQSVGPPRFCHVSVSPTMLTTQDAPPFPDPAQTALQGPRSVLFAEDDQLFPIPSLN